MTTFVRVFDRQAQDVQPGELTPVELEIIGLMAQRKIERQLVLPLDETSYGPHTRLMNTLLKQAGPDCVVDVSGWNGFSEIDRMQLDLVVVRSFNAVIVSASFTEKQKGDRRLTKDNISVIRRPEDVFI